MEYEDSTISCKGPGGLGSVQTGEVQSERDQWHHFAVTRKASTGLVSIYWDGNIKQSGTMAEGDMPNGDDKGAYTLHLGDVTGMPKAAYVGLMDDVSVWTKALSPSDVLKIRGSVTPSG